MRKSKRFIKKFSERFIVYIVVFVAFVNACFFVPMEVQASNNLSTTYYLGEASTIGTPYFANSSNHGSGILLHSDSYTPSTSSTITYDQWFTVFLTSDDFDAGDYFEFETRLRFVTNEVSHVSLSLVNLWPTFSVCSPTYSTAIDSDSNIYNNYDITFSSEIVRQSDIASYYYIRVSGSYNSIYNLAFTFRLRFNLDPITSTSAYTLYWTVENESLVVSGSESSVSQNLQDLVDGYNDSTGNQVSSDFESGVNDYDQAEDNLFNTSTGALQGFEFFNFGSFSAVTSGLSFCSSLLTSIYENFGGLNGIGIVISVLFSVLFMAIVIGLFRYYK